MTNDKSKKHEVVLEKRPCSKCETGGLFAIIQPNGIGTGTLYENIDEALEVAEELQRAYEMGVDSVKSKPQKTKEKAPDFETRVKIIQAMRPTAPHKAWNKNDLIAIGVKYPPPAGWLSRYLLGEDPNNA